MTITTEAAQVYRDREGAARWNPKKSEIRSLFGAVDDQKTSNSGDTLTGPLVGTAAKYIAGPETGWSGWVIGTPSQSALPNTLGFTKVQALATDGNWAVMGASRASDTGGNPGGQSTGGLLGYALNDDAAFPKTAYGIYLESRATAAAVTAQIAAGSGATHGFEVAIVNFGSTVETNPYFPNTPGLSDCRITIGREDRTDDTDVSAALQIVNANKGALRGIVVSNEALASGGPLEALSVAINHRLAWYDYDAVGAAGFLSSYISGARSSFRAISNTDAVAYTYDFVRSRLTGTVTAGDILGVTRYLTRTGATGGAGTEAQLAQIFAMKDTGTGARLVMAATNTDGVALGVALCQGGANSFTPTLTDEISVGTSALKFATGWFSGLVTVGALTTAGNVAAGNMTTVGLAASGTVTALDVQTTTLTSLNTFNIGNPASNNGLRITPTAATTGLTLIEARGVDANLCLALRGKGPVSVFLQDSAGANIIDVRTASLGFFGAEPAARQTLSAAATDAASTQTLANSLRTALLNYGIAT